MGKGNHYAGKNISFFIWKKKLKHYLCRPKSGVSSDWGLKKRARTSFAKGTEEKSSLKL
jgi:hypothetical protein